MQLLSRVLTLTDHARHAVENGGPPEEYKEWFHFCILGPSLDLVVNFSFTGTGQARVILLLHEEQGDWSGEVVDLPARDVHINPGRIDLRFGQNWLSFQDDQFCISVALQSHPITIDLRLQPITFPLLRSRAPIGKGSIDWLVVPRLAASGTVISGARLYRLEGAPCYHDHNWGHWQWGQDFAWEWGFALPTSRAAPWSLVFDRMTNRARNDIQDLKLCVWKAGKLARIFAHEDIHVRPQGYFSPPGIPKFPPIMALVAPEMTTDVPRCLEIEAASGNDFIRWRFEAQALAQIVVPNETDLYETIINEVAGSLKVTGQVKGELVELEGKGFFEFLT